MRRVAGLVAVILVAACSSGRPVSSPTSTSTSTTQAPPTTVTVGRGPLVPTLPDGCAAQSPAKGTVVSFVAGGRAWAVDPDDASTLTCLFEVGSAGIFSWGPQGDRVVLAGLEVRGVGVDVSRPPADLHPSYFSWSRPTGTTVVFTDQRQHTIDRADIGTATARDITPLPDKTYGDIAYHPSGLAIAFVAKAEDGTPSIFVAGNQGENAELLLAAAGPETTFEHLVFAHDGVGLLYTLDRADTHAVERYDLVTGAVEEVASFDAPVHDVLERQGLPMAFTLGSQCSERTVAVQAAPGAGSPVSTVTIAGTSGPMSAIGRLDEHRLVVAVGGCDGPADVYVANPSTGEATLLVRGVDAAAFRMPEPSPPPPLPDRLPQSGFA